jgi:hypothetical protein
MDNHRFRIGQQVNLSLGVSSHGRLISCKIVQLLPFDGSSFQYRVKNANEAFERIASEDELAVQQP